MSSKRKDRRWNVSSFRAAVGNSVTLVVMERRRKQLRIIHGLRTRLLIYCTNHRFCRDGILADRSYRQDGCPILPRHAACPCPFGITITKQTRRIY